MPTVIFSYPSDSPDNTHYILDYPFNGTVEATVTGLAYGYYGPPGDGGEPSFKPGDPVTEVSCGLQGQREFELAGNVTLMTFIADDGTTSTWTPNA